MGDSTSIEWTDATWNPIRGCRRTAPKGSKQSGCGDPTGGGCYAERQAARQAGPGGAYEGLITLTDRGPRWSGAVRFVADHLMDPMRWRRPRRIFTDSMSDLFYDGFDDWHIDRVVAVMMICCLADDRAGHIFQTLTKRPARMRAYLSNPKTQERVARAAGQLMEDGDGWYDLIAFREEGLLHPHLWWGTSIENQAAADERILELAGTPACVRFVSAEPLIGRVVLGLLGILPATITGSAYVPVHDRIHWVIAGCESGPGARKCDTHWLRALRDECADAEVAFFLKQATEDTEYAATYPSARAGKRPIYNIAVGAGSSVKPRRGYRGAPLITIPELDGVQHKAFPEVAGLRFPCAA